MKNDDIYLNKIEKSPDIPSLVASQIIERIRSGALKEGDKLPSEQAMTQKFGISRISLREAMKILETKGYIESQGRKGKFIKSADDLHLESAIEEFISVDHEKIWELLAVRRIIDSEGARMAAENATNEQIVNLKKFESGVKEIGIKNLVMSKEGGRLYYKFYNTLADITNNAIFAHLMKSISSLLKGALPYSRQKLMSVDNVSFTFYEHHESIIKYIEQRDPQGAKKAVILHIDWLEETLKEILE